jgi:hypothetical protein
MKTVLRNVMAVLVAFVVGSFVNMALIVASPHVIPPPAGVDVSNAASMKASIHLFEARHFLFPFLAHALGTLVGASTAFLLAASHRAKFAYAIGALFLAGGVTACFMIPAPAWFMVVDLAGAYLPMAWLGTVIGRRLGGATGQPEK